MVCSGLGHSFPGSVWGSFSERDAVSRQCRAIPLPLAAVVALEQLVLNADASTPDRLIAAAFLTSIWASLRFSDCQHVFWSSLLLDTSALRGVSHRTKTSRRGVPFICVGSGLLSRPDSPATWWTTTFLHLLEERRQALCARMQTVAFAPDALFFWDALHSGDSEAEGCFAPLQYGVALKWLRISGQSRFGCGAFVLLYPAQRQGYAFVLDEPAASISLPSSDAGAP